MGQHLDAPPLAGELSAKPTEGAALQSNAVTEGFSSLTALSLPLIAKNIKKELVHEKRF